MRQAMAGRAGEYNNTLAQRHAVLLDTLSRSISPSSPLSEMPLLLMRVYFQT